MQVLSSHVPSLDLIFNVTWEEPVTELIHSNDSFHYNQIPIFPRVCYFTTFPFSSVKFKTIAQVKTPRQKGVKRLRSHIKSAKRQK